MLSAKQHSMYPTFTSRPAARAFKTNRRSFTFNATRREREEGSYEQEIITFFTQDGIVRIPGREVKVEKPHVPKQPMPTWEEQALCIGASFSVAATNGHDPTRRVNFEGFCQSIDVLHECVEDVVKSRGGDILAQERALKSGVHETLTLIVAIPYLWGVPPQLDALSSAIKYGGGIVERVYKCWGMYQLPARPVYSYVRVQPQRDL